MKLITPILLICIYFLSLVGPGLKAFDCCGSDQQVFISWEKQNEGNKNYNANCHSLKLKDAHIISSAAKVSNGFNAQANRLPYSYAQQFLSQNTPVNPTANNYSAALHIVPAYLYGCVLRI